jgi:biotin operon repressor
VRVRASAAVAGPGAAETLDATRARVEDTVDALRARG